jgi:rod shape determining protein RodA
MSRLDWVTVMLWLVMMIMGWLNIYAAVYNENIQASSTCHSVTESS